jgi:hypothetical protein
VRAKAGARETVPAPDPIHVYATLAGEPFLLRPEEIGRLTDWQITRLLGAKRNKDGQVEEEATVPARMTMAQKKLRFLAIGVSLGQNPKVLSAQWEAKYGGSD